MNGGWTPASSGARWSRIARKSSRATVLGSCSGSSSSTTRNCSSGTSSSSRSNSDSTGVTARRMSWIGSASGEARTASALIRESPAALPSAAARAWLIGLRAGRSSTCRRTRSSTPETRRTSPSASSSRSGSAISRRAGMTASTKPIRPEMVLRSKRPAWWSIRYSTSGFAFEIAASQAAGDSRTTSSGSLPSGRRATRTSSSFTPRCPTGAARSARRARSRRACRRSRRRGRRRRPGRSGSCSA